MSADRGLWAGPGLVATLALLLAALAGAAPALAKSKGAAHKPAAQECAAVTLSGVPNGTADGPQQAGFYKSQLGRLELHAEVRGGVARDYRLGLAGQTLSPAPRPWPKAVTACLKAKGVGNAGHDPVDCQGDRFQVIMTRAASAQYLLLYTMTRPGPWRFCRAQMLP